ncbi:unnamed protein product [Brassica oleracea var. botrytis]
MATVVITFFCHYILLAKGMGMESWSRPKIWVRHFTKSLQKPWAASEIQYGQNKGKLYNGECDEFMTGAPQGLSSMLCLSKLARTCAVPDTTAYCLKASRRLFHMGSPSNEKDPQEVLHCSR